MPGIVWLLAVAAALVGAMAPTPWWQLGIIAVAVAACAAFGRIRSPALRFGVIAALVFVAVRVAYRIVFTSTVAPPVGAVLLIDLPVIPLGGPFRGIALFGPLTLDQLLATIADASRFAAVFVVFGAANAIADARTLLARAPRPFLPLATVLALALGAVPALIASVQRVDRAARMRGEGRGPRLLVPVLEQAVERATTLGASMELRGFPAAGPASAPPSTPPSTPAPTLPSAQTQAPAPAREPCASVLLRAEGLSVQYGGGSDASAGRETVTGANLELRAGELALLTGPTGSGKSTLLRALAGLAPAYTGGRVSGALEVLGREVLGSGSDGAGPGAGLRPARLSGLVALVPQRVEHSFLAETVRAELAFAPARRGVSGDELADAVDRGLERFGLTGLAERDPATLSAGEATRAALAAACLARPRVLLLDEPIADLDPRSVDAVLAALRSLLGEGCAVVIAEHRPEPLAALGEAPIRRFEMRAGELWPIPGEGSAAAGIAEVARSAEAVGTAGTAGTSGIAGAAETPAVRPEAASRSRSRPDGDGRGAPIVLASDLRVERGGRPLLHVDELAVRPGEIAVLTGPNGVGKTSLLESIALPRGAKGRAAGVALVPQRVDDLLIRDALADECRFADRRARAEAGATARRFERLVAGSIPASILPSLPATHPRDLSAGTRLALGIAVQLAYEPEVLLLDEPTRGLDRDARRRLAAMLAELAGEGTAVLLATHDAGFAGLLRAEGAGIRSLRLEAEDLGTDGATGTDDAAGTGGAAEDHALGDPAAPARIVEATPDRGLA